MNLFDMIHVHGVAWGNINIQYVHASRNSKHTRSFASSQFRPKPFLLQASGSYSSGTSYLVTCVPENGETHTLPLMRALLGLPMWGAVCPFFQKKKGILRTVPYFKKMFLNKMFNHKCSPIKKCSRFQKHVCVFKKYSQNSINDREVSKNVRWFKKIVHKFQKNIHNLKNVNSKNAHDFKRMFMIL